jgi:SAM-dependent methyltransferase
MAVGGVRVDREELTELYLARPVDSRMVGIIDRYLVDCSSVLDVACGSGLYGPALRRRVPSVIGVDSDPVLCAAASDRGVYDQVVCDRAQNAGAHLERVDAVFCSEFLEHVGNAERAGLLGTLETIASRRVVLTVPNPLSPHFRVDPTHIARYSIYSLLRTLNASHSFRYRLRALGFSDYNRGHAWARALHPVASRVALCSPTVLYVGDRVRESFKAPLSPRRSGRPVGNGEQADLAVTGDRDIMPGDGRTRSRAPE